MKEAFCYKVKNFPTVYYLKFRKGEKCYMSDTFWFVIRVYKINPHRYDLRCFFYGSKNIYVYQCSSKMEVVDHIKYLIHMEKVDGAKHF